MTAEQLKASLLQMAIQGKLVPQIDDEPAVDIDAKEPEEVPFAIPEKWKWVRLGIISTIVRGGSPRPIQNFITSRSDGINWIKIGDSTRGQRYITQCKEKIIPEGKVKSRFVKAGSLILSNSMSFGYPYILKIDGCIHDGWLAISDFEKDLFVEFAYFLLLSPYCRSSFTINAAGAVVKNLNIEKVEKLYIPLPPLAEQRRIVARLNELLPLVEEYGKSQSALHVLETELPGKLRASLLQQAIMGKLVPQLDDEPAVDIDAEEPEEVPFVIPEKWKWVRLRDIGAIFSGATPKTNVTEYWSPAIVPWVTPADLGKNKKKTISCGEHSISKKGYLSCSAVLLPKGSVVYSSRAPIGHIAITENELATNQGCKSIAPNFEIVLSEYVYYGLIALTPDIQSRASGTTFLEISSKKFGETFFPLPPLAEQRRIITRLNELLPYLNSMIKN